MTEGPSQTPKPFLSTLADEEVHRRVKELIALGNSPKVTELILLQAGALPEQVNEGLKKFHQEKQAELKEQNYLGWVVMLVSFILVLLAIYLWLNWPAGNQKATVASAPLSDAFVNDLLQTFLDDQNIPPVHDLPEPFVEFYEAGQDASCPFSEEKAIALFGGGSGKWAFQTDANGWLFYNNTPSQITIPANMAGSLASGSARSPKFSPAIGPVKVSNVYMAFILCTN